MADGESTEDHNYTTLQVEYRLTNGCTVRRSYYGLYLNDAGWEELRQLFTSDEIVRQRNPVLQLGQGDVQLDSLSLSGLDGENTPVDTATARLLLEAAQKDIFHTLTQNHGYIGDVSGFLNVRCSYPAQTYEGKRLTTDNRYADIQIPLYDGFESTGALLQEENLALAPFDPRTTPMSMRAFPGTTCIRTPLSDRFWADWPITALRATPKGSITTVTWATPSRPRRSRILPYR